MDYINLLLTGAAGAAIIKLADNVIQWRLARKAKKEDKAEEKNEEKEAALAAWRKRSDETDEALTLGVMCLLLDRIQYLGQAYIREGTVDFDDRRRLHKMHEAYHGLGGNGDLDELLREINELPLKED